MATLQEIRERFSSPRPYEEMAKEDVRASRAKWIIDIDGHRTHHLGAEGVEFIDLAARVTRLVSGQTYRVTGSMRGDGTAPPRIVIGGKIIWEGHRRQGVQGFDVTYVHPAQPPRHLHCKAVTALGCGMSVAMKSMGVSFATATVEMGKWAKLMRDAQETAAKAKAAARERANQNRLAKASGSEVDDLIDAMRHAVDVMKAGGELWEPCPLEKREKPIYPKRKLLNGQLPIGYSSSSMKSSASRWTRPQAMRSRSSRRTGPKMTMR